MKSIKEKIEELHNLYLKVEERRENWNSKTKDLIFSTLSNITKEINVDWNVYHNDTWKNCETIYLTCGNYPSGVIETTEKGRKMFAKHGGSLSFSQVYNGEVYIIFKQPYIETLIEETPSEFIEKISPENITKEYIEQKFSDFLQVLIDWENFKE